MSRQKLVFGPSDWPTMLCGSCLRILGSPDLGRPETERVLVLVQTVWEATNLCLVFSALAGCVEAVLISQAQ